MDLQLLLTALTAALVVVFIALVFLAVRVGRYGSDLHSLQSRLDGKQAERVLAPAARPAVPAAQSAPAAAEGIPSEILAVISAAVFCMFPEGAVTSVRRAGASARARSPWGMAGVLENTRPF